MAYRVIKRVKGIAYLYEQISFRVGSRVHTKSRCLGRADGIGGAVSGVAGASCASGSSEAQVAHGDSGALSVPEVPAIPGNDDGADIISKIRRSDQQNGQNIPRPVITTRFRSAIPLAGHKISTFSLQKEYENAQVMLRNAGVSSEQFPSITIKYGWWVKPILRRRTGQYVVCLPKKSSGHRMKFKRCYSQTVARSMLDSVARHAPQKYAVLAQEFDSSFRETQKAITTFIFAAKAPNAVLMLLALRQWGVIRKAKKVLPSPERIGLIDFSKRKTWRDELTAIMGTIHRKGFARVHADHQKQLSIAKREFTTARNIHAKCIPLSPRWWRSRRRQKTAIARLHAQELFSGKLSTIQRVFCLES